MVAAAREIENLIYRYAELLDDGELEAVADLFSTACIVAPDGSEAERCFGRPEHGDVLDRLRVDVERPRTRQGKAVPLRSS